MINMKWLFCDDCPSGYLSPDEIERVYGLISLLRSARKISVDERVGIVSLLNIGRRRYNGLIEYRHNHPRRVAQKFIGKKSIRNFIFSRDGFECLRCYSIEKLTIDHIVPIHLGGGNKLMNLQTLCRSCNSWKSTKIIDYR